MELVLAFFFIGLAAVLIYNELRRRKFAALSIVQAGAEYPNNHHVLGVGYYHAAARRWFPHPWNEFRETQGYYWDGTWHPAPDQRTVLKSAPPEGEIFRVNQEWRSADPDRMQRFWSTVERQGFGTALRRSEGS